MYNPLIPAPITQTLESAGSSFSCSWVSRRPGFVVQSISGGFWQIFDTFGLVLLGNLLELFGLLANLLRCQWLCVGSLAYTDVVGRLLFGDPGHGCRHGCHCGLYRAEDVCQCERHLSAGGSRYCCDKELVKNYKLRGSGPLIYLSTKSKKFYRKGISGLPDTRSDRSQSRSSVEIAFRCWLAEDLHTSDCLGNVHSRQGVDRTILSRAKSQVI